MLNGSSSDSANRRILEKLTNAGNILPHEQEILAIWWEEVQFEWQRLRWNDPLLKGSDERAGQLQQAIKAGRKFLKEVLKDEIRKQLICDELIRVPVIPDAVQRDLALMVAMDDRQDHPTAEEFFQEQLAILNAPIDEEIKSIENMIARLENQADRLIRDGGTKQEGPNSKHARRIIALNIYDIWTVRLQRPFNLGKNREGGLQFAFEVYAALGQPYSEEDTLRKQLERWLNL